MGSKWSHGAGWRSLLAVQSAVVISHHQQTGYKVQSSPQAKEDDVISGEEHVKLHFPPLSVLEKMFCFVFFTCVSISTTCKPMLDTFWFIKCKMAWKEKDQQIYLDHKTSFHVRILLFLSQHCSVGCGRLIPLLVIPASPCWPCEPPASAVGRWDLPLGKTSSGNSHFRLQFCTADSQHVKWGKLLYSLWTLPRASPPFLFKNTLCELPENCHGEAQNDILLTDHLWELPSLCGIWFLSRWPADGGEIGSISQRHTCV